MTATHALVMLFGWLAAGAGGWICGTAEAHHDQFGVALGVVIALIGIALSAFSGAITA